jgi:hypothetical protein
MDAKEKAVPMGHWLVELRHKAAVSTFGRGPDSQMDLDSRNELAGHLQDPAWSTLGAEDGLGLLKPTHSRWRPRSMTRPGAWSGNRAGDRRPDPDRPDHRR